MKKYIAECFGTMMLVLFGCGTAVIAGDAVGTLGIAVAFGLAIVAMAYSIGSISGCHINPAVSLALFINNKLSAKDLGMYALFQTIGAIIGALILSFIVGDTSSLGTNVVADGYTVMQGFVFEFIFTAVFVMVILGVTHEKNHLSTSSLAGLVIGLTLIVIHLVGINVTGTSVNPARSIGPALVSMDSMALSQLWIFILAPLLGAVAGGYFHKYLEN